MTSLLEKAKAKGPVRESKPETKDDVYKAIERLNYTFSQTEQLESLTGNPVDPHEMHANAEAIQDIGALTGRVNAITDEEVSETVSGIPNEIESMLAGITDPTTRDITLQNIQSMGLIAANEQAVKQLVRGGLLKDSFAAPIYEEQDRLNLERRQAEAAQTARQMTEMLHAGFSKDQAEAELKGLGVPVYSPEDVVVDLMMGAIMIPYRLGKSALGYGTKSSMEILKMAKKEIPEHLYYGTLAGGFMSVADYANGGALTTALSGILGPTLTGVLATGTRRGFADFLIKTKEKNPKMFLDLMDQFKIHKDQKMSKVALEIIDDIEAGRVSLTGERLVEISPFVRTNVGSEGEVDRVSKIIVHSLDPEDSKLQQSARTALGVTDSTAHLTVQPYLGEVIEKELLVQNMTNLSTSMHNAVTTGRLIGRHAMIDSGFEDRVNDLVYNRFYQDGSFITGDVVHELFRTGQAAEVGKGVASHLLTATSKMRNAAGQLVEVPTHLYRQVEEFQRVAKKLNKQIKGKLSSKEIKELDGILYDGSSLDRMFKATKEGLIDPKDGRVITQNPRIIDSWSAYRKFTDQMHHQWNQALNRDLIAQGYRMIDDSMVGVEIPASKAKGQKLADGTEFVDDGTSKVFMIKSFDGSGGEKLVMIPVTHLPHRVKDIDTNLQTLGYRENYAPMILDKDLNRFFITALDKKTLKTKTIAAGKTKGEAEELANRLSKSDEGVAYIAHQKGLQADTGAEDIGINGDLLNFLRRQNAVEVQRLEKMLVNSGEFDQHTVDFMVKLAKKYNFGGDHFAKRRETRVKSIESIQKQLDELDPKDAELIKKAISQAEDAPLVPSTDAIAQYADKLARRINTHEYNGRLRREFEDTYRDVLETGHWNSRVLTGADGLTGSQLQKSVEAKVRQEQLATIFNVPSIARQHGQDRLNVKLMELDQSDSILYKHLGSTFYKAIYADVDKASLAARQFGSAAAFLFNGSQFVVQQSGMLLALGKHMFTDPASSVLAMRDTNDVIVKGMLKRSLGLKVDPEVELKLRLLDRSGFIAGQGGDFLDDIRDIGKYRTLAGQAIDRAKDVGYVPLRTGEAIQRSVSWFAEYRAMESAIKNGTHPRLKMKDLNTDKMIAEVNLSAERIAGNFTKLNRGTLTKDGVMSAVFQFFQFPQIATEIMFGRAAKLTGLQRTGVWAAWGGAFGLEGVPMLWDLTERAEIMTNQQGYLKEFVRESVAEATRELSASIGLSTDVQEFLATTTTRGGLAALTNDQLAFAHRASIASMTPRFFDTMDIMDLMGPGLAAMIGVASGTILTLEDMKAAFDKGYLDDPEVIARSVKLNLNKVSAIRNLATAVGEDGALIDRYGDKVIDQMTPWQRLQIAVGIMPWEFIERNQNRWEARQRERQERDNVKAYVERLSRVSNPQMQLEIYIETAQALAEEGDPVALKQFFSDGTRYMINRNLSAEYRDMMIRMQELKRGAINE